MYAVLLLSAFNYSVLTAYGASTVNTVSTSTAENYNTGECQTISLSGV